MKNEISILLADDEESILFTVEKLIIKIYPGIKIYRASDGTAAFDIIEKSHPSIIVADYTMPGLNGIQLCRKIRENQDYKDIYYILLTGKLDDSIVVEAFQLGADDFVTKPLKNDEFQSRIRAAMRIVKMQNDLKEENKLLQKFTKELEAGIRDITLIAMRFLQTRIPNSYDMLRRVSHAAVWIARQLGDLTDLQIRNIAIAADLSLAGKLCLPDNLLKIPVMSGGRPSHKLMFNVPVKAKEIFSGVSFFKDIANILYHLYENLDGSGMPERLQSWQIPIGARIIRVALDYEEMLDEGKSPEAALALIQSQIKRVYDQRVVILFENYIKDTLAEGSEITERAMQLSELEEGMIVTRDIIAGSGLKLIPAGATLTEQTIHKIFSHNASDPILGFIYVKHNK